jgi:hypothetical protein
MDNQNNNAEDKLKQYLDVITNMKKFDKDMINTIQYMPEQDKMEIIIMFNKVVQYMVEIIDYILE